MSYTKAVLLHSFRRRQSTSCHSETRRRRWEILLFWVAIYRLLSAKVVGTPVLSDTFMVDVSRFASVEVVCSFSCSVTLSEKTCLIVASSGP